MIVPMHAQEFVIAILYYHPCSDRMQAGIYAHQRVGRLQKKIEILGLRSHHWKPTPHLIFFWSDSRACRTQKR